MSHSPSPAGRHIGVGGAVVPDDHSRNAPGPGDDRAMSSSSGAVDAERCPGSQLEPFQRNLRQAAQARAVASTLQPCQGSPDFVEDALDAETLGLDHEVVRGLRKRGEHRFTCA
jgi:hypothetical protein